MQFADMHYDREPASTFQDLLASFALDEFASPWRSTVPLLEGESGDRPLLNQTVTLSHHQVGV
jgi:hypothetical protein